MSEGSLMATTMEPLPQPVFKEPRPINPNSLPFFSRIVEDIMVNIFSRLEEDPRDLARLACVCRKFRIVIKSSCYKRQCMRVVPTIVSELMQSSSQQDVLGEPPGGWGALQKLLVCCPGLRHTGVLLNCWDYGLEREIGWSDDFRLVDRDNLPKMGVDAQKDIEAGSEDLLAIIEKQEKTGCLLDSKCVEIQVGGKNLEASLTVHGKNQESGTEARDGRKISGGRDVGKETNVVEMTTTLEGEKCQGQTSVQRVNSIAAEIMEDVHGGSCMVEKRRRRKLIGVDGPVKQMKEGGLHYHCKVMSDSRFHGSYRQSDWQEECGGSRSSGYREGRRSRGSSGDRKSGRRSIGEGTRINHEEEPHLAKGTWILTREQGNKLLASRFRSDSLYICDWPGCMHQGEKRVYKLFRGIFKNFQQSHVFRNLRDLRAKHSEIQCAFCSKGTYDMVTSFCLRRSFEYHEDGEPVIRAYVCESGHVAGAWTDRPLYNL